MWKNIWPLLILGAAAYALYTGWNPFPGGDSEDAEVVERSAGAGGPAGVREIQQMPDAISDHGRAVHNSGGSASGGRAAKDRARAVGGARGDD